MFKCFTTVLWGQLVMKEKVDLKRDGNSLKDHLCEKYYLAIFKNFLFGTNYIYILSVLLAVYFESKPAIACVVLCYILVI